jgi:hypothetical protein
MFNPDCPDCTTIPCEVNDFQFVIVDHTTTTTTFNPTTTTTTFL